MQRKWILFSTVGGCILLLAGSIKAETFSYWEFDSRAGLILQAHAALPEGRLRLTPAAGGKGLGGAWRELKQPVQGGFDTTFRIQITDKRNFGADGFAFAIQNGPSPRLGLAGYNIGFGGLSNLFVVKFDNYHWHENEFRNYDEIAVLAPGAPARVLWDNPADTFASVTNGIHFSDGAIHTVRIHYVPGNLQVYLDDLDEPVMTVYLNLTKILDLDDGQAWVGFTAACGADWQNQDVLSWQFASYDAAGTLKRLMEELRAKESPAAEARVFGSDSSNRVPLEWDRTFGYHFPSEVAVSHEIEVSSDLIHWTQATNITLFFRDLDSPGHDARFYRFRRKP